MKKNIKFKEEARRSIREGIDELANAVKITLGPRGRNVIMDRDFNPPYITNDGVTVAKEISLPDPAKNMGAQLVKSVASKTNDDAGDGTTTASVLIQAIVNAGEDALYAGGNPIDIKRGIDEAIKVVVKHIADISIPVEADSKRIKQVATISANGDEFIGSLIADAFKTVGKDGIITVEESRNAETYVKVVEGMELHKGYVSQYFATNEKNECVLENPYILFYDGKISTIQNLVPILETISQSNSSFLIVANEVEGEARATLITNKMKYGLKVAAITAPEFGELRSNLLQDAAILTGGVVISETLGDKLEECKLDDLGKCDKIVITKDKTLLHGGKGNKLSIKTYIDTLKKQLENSDNDDEFLMRRLAKLSNGVAILYVGAFSEVEMKEKKDRVDDALCATKAAVQEGIVPGGGVAYIRAIKALEGLQSNNSDAIKGIEIIKTALRSPLRQIAENSGVEWLPIVQAVEEGENDFGYNAKTGEFEKLLDAGVIDPAKVARVALENAGSVAGTFLTTECTIINIFDPQ